VYCHFFFSEGYVCNDCDWPRFPSLWLGPCGGYSATAPAALSLRPLVPNGSLIRCEPFQVYDHHHLYWGLCFWCLFFCFRGGWPLHSARSLTFHNRMEIPTAHFTTSNLRVCLTVLLNALLLPRRSCHLAHRFFIPLFHSGPFWCLFSDVSPLWPCPLCRAGTAWRVICLRAMANFFWGPPSPWVCFFGCQRRPTARYWSPYWSSNALISSHCSLFLRDYLILH
jgi:hypothetical protein